MTASWRQPARRACASAVELTDEDASAQAAIVAQDLLLPGETEPPDELAGLLADPDSGPPSGADAWLFELAWPVREALLEARAAAERPTVGHAQEPFPTGFIYHDHAGSGGAGFASGSVLDTLAPGPVLASALDDTWQAGLERLGEDELAGVALAWRRSESRAAAGLAAAVSELSRRRIAGGDRQVIDHVDDEIAALFTLTCRSAGRLIGFADQLSVLPATMAALAAGRIDRARAEVITWETGLLAPGLARAVELLVIEDAPSLTTTQLTARLRHAVLAADPDAARRRKEEAAKDARVELSGEPCGTAALVGRDLPVPAALAADQRIDAAARALKAGGHKARLTQLRAAVFLGLLTGNDPLVFVPVLDHDSGAGTDDGEAADRGAAKAHDDPHAPDPAQGDHRDPKGWEPQDASPADSGQPGTSPDEVAPQVISPEGHAPEGPRPCSAGPLALRGSVHLTMPLAAWLGVTRSPGEIAGFGPASSDTCQELAAAIAASPGSRWCLTLTDTGGHATGHGCARRPPPTDHPGIAAWLSALKVKPVEAGICSHTREAAGYRIPASMDHIVSVRQRTCFHPSCVRPAARCDTDHSIAYDQGGRTCECNLGPGCRTHHQAKQAHGWHLIQPSPGVLAWQLPHGRTYMITPGVYPQ